MPRPLRHLILLTALVLGSYGALAPIPAAAQDEDDEPVLPDIAPREIEIRGTLEISLPSLERQPLSGFNPPPRIPDIPDDRTPHIGTYDQDRSDLPLQMPEPPGLAAQLEQPAPPLSGELAAGGGRYFTRFANGQVWLPLSTYESLTVAGDYRGSSGFEPFTETPNVETPFDTFEALVNLQSRRDGFSLNANLEGYFDTYTLYGATPNTQNPRLPILVDQPDRQGAHLAGNLDLATHGLVELRLYAGVSGTGYETSIYTTDDEAPRVAERRIRGGGALAVPVGTAHATVDADFEMAGLDPDGRFTNDVTSLDAGLGARILTRPELRLDAGGRFLLASIGPAPRPDLTARSSARFLVPSFSLDWTVGPSASVFAKNTPGVAPHPLAELFGENPYLFDAVTVQPSLRTTDASAGLRLFSGPFQMVTRGGYRHVVSYQYFASGASVSSSTDPLAYEEGVFVPRYGSARIAHAGAEVSLQRMNGIEVSLGATYRHGRLTDGDTVIPHFAPVVGQAVLSYAFLDQRGWLQLTGRFEGARYVDRAERTQLDPFVDLDFEASYDITPSLGLIVELHNITGGSLERWSRYPRPPLVLTSGLRVQW